MKRFINTVDEEMDTALHIASQSGYLDTVAVLLELGGDVNARTDTNASPLHLAAAGGHTEIVQLLVDHGGEKWIEN